MRSAVASLRRMERKAHSAGVSPMIEALEGRQFLSCSASTAGSSIAASALTAAKVVPLATGVDGTYTGTVEFNHSGITTPITLVLSGGGTKVQGTINVRKGVALKANFKTSFIAGPAGIQIASFNTTVGGGTVQVKDGQLSLDASLDILLGAVQIHVSAVKGNSVQNLPPQSRPDDPHGPITTLSTRPLAVNPLIGRFSGKLSAPSSVAGYSFNAVVAAKKGTTKLSFVDTIRLGNFGEMVLSFAVSAHSNGKFTQNLGATESEGTITGHFGKTGKLVLTINVPNFPLATGSAQRL